MKSLRVVLVLLALAALWYWQQTSMPPPSGTEARTSTPLPDARSELPAPQPLPPLPERDARSTSPAAAPSSTPSDSRALPAFLPREAHDTLALIAGGGPFPHRQDGGIFQNRERRLPSQARGYYREYTVRTPGESDRGARRIVTGGHPPAEYWYTDDHYDSFRRFEVPR